MVSSTILKYLIKKDKVSCTEAKEINIESESLLLVNIREDSYLFLMFMFAEIF